MNSITDQQARHNRQSRNGWQSATGHRRRVMQQLLRLAGTDKNIGVLGAGNCNDIDLKQLCTGFENVTLIDIDRDAVVGGVERQLGESDEPHEKISVPEPWELTGIANLLTRFSSSAPSDQSAMLDTMFQRLRESNVAPWAGAFDVVASVGLLSQLVHSVTQWMEGQAEMLRVIQAVRRQHVLQCIEMLRSGGTGLLVVDFVSTDTAPLLLAANPHELSKVARGLINDRNFFTGLNPAQIEQILLTDEVISPQIAGLQVNGPWLWDFGPRHYAVYAFEFQRVV